MADNFDEYLATLNAKRDENRAELIRLQEQISAKQSPSLEDNIGGAISSAIPLLLGGLLGGTQGAAAAGPVATKLGTEHFANVKADQQAERAGLLSLFNLLKTQDTALGTQSNAAMVANLKGKADKVKADEANATKKEVARIRAAGGGSSRSVAASVDERYTDLLQRIQNGEEDFGSADLSGFNKSQLDSLSKADEIAMKRDLSPEAKELLVKIRNRTPFSEEDNKKLSSLPSPQLSALLKVENDMEPPPAVHPRLRFIEESGFGLRPGAFFGTDKAGDAAAKDAASDVLLIRKIERAREKLIETEGKLAEYNFLQKIPPFKVKEVESLNSEKLDALTAIFGAAKEKANLGKALTANEEKFAMALFSKVPEFSNEYAKGDIKKAITVGFATLVDQAMKGDVLTQTLPGVDSALIDLYDRLNSLGVVPLSKLKEAASTAGENSGTDPAGPPPPGIDPKVWALAQKMYSQGNKNKQQGR